jgi:hypothetical protein
VSLNKLIGDGDHILSPPAETEGSQDFANLIPPLSNVAWRRRET